MAQSTFAFAASLTAIGKEGSCDLFEHCSNASSASNPRQDGGAEGSGNILPLPEGQKSQQFQRQSRKERCLEARAAALVSILSSLCDCVVYLDHNFVIRNDSPLGYLLRRSSLRGQRFLDLCAPSQAQRLETHMASMNRSPSSTCVLSPAFHLMLLDVDSQAVAVEIKHSHFEGMSGSVEHILAVSAVAEPGLSEEGERLQVPPSCSSLTSASGLYAQPVQVPVPRSQPIKKPAEQEEFDMRVIVDAFTEELQVHGSTDAWQAVCGDLASVQQLLGSALDQFKPELQRQVNAAVYSEWRPRPQCLGKVEFQSPVDGSLYCGTLKVLVADPLIVHEEDETSYHVSLCLADLVQEPAAIAEEAIVLADLELYED